MTPNGPPSATTEAGAALMAWAQSDARPIQDFGFDSVEDAVVLIEAEARRAADPCDACGASSLSLRHFEGCPTIARPSFPFDFAERVD